MSENIFPQIDEKVFENRNLTYLIWKKKIQSYIVPQLNQKSSQTLKEWYTESHLNHHWILTDQHDSHWPHVATEHLNWDEWKLKCAVNIKMY